MNISRTICLLVILNIISNNIGAQYAIKLSGATIDFGKIASLNYPPKVLEFENTSDKKLAILIIERSSEVIANFERKFYSPGEKGFIYFKYNANKSGLFEEQILIYNNLDNEPSLVTIKGTVISVLECFPDQRNMLKRNIDVIDIYTKKGIPEARVSFIHNFKTSNPIEVKTDNEGKAIEALQIGQYLASSNVEGYENFSHEFFLPKSQPNVLLELTPKKKLPPTLPPTEIINKEELFSKPTEKNSVIVTSTELPENLYAANNIILLLDVSTSMKSGKKFILLQQAINNLVMILRPIDQVSIITYSTNAQTILTGVSGNQKEEIFSVLESLKPYGITKGVKGLNTAYSLAESSYISGGNNQIILATDGEFSEKGVDDSYYSTFLEEKSNKGIVLSILGFGINQEAILRMKTMTKAGGGTFLLVKSDDYIKDVLIDEIKANSLLKE